jgi:hypothetical protein
MRRTLLRPSLRPPGTGRGLLLLPLLPLLALGSLVSRSALALPAAAGPAAPAARLAARLPEEPRALERTVSYGEMEAILGELDGKGPIRVSVEGKTVQGRSLFVVHAFRGEGRKGPRWKMLLYAQQHGDEISGKDALLFLLRDIARRPELLPEEVDLWVLPMMNPDGAEAGTRRNGAGVDLNRDHIGLEQPETRVLHKVALSVRPDVAVDCHEFARDPEEWRAKGWAKWPDITFDGMNNPLLAPELVGAARAWVDRIGEAEGKAGHPFLRYWVGGLPPYDEQRHSAPDLDSALNSIGALGGLSFIAEAAAPTGKAAAGDLGNRVDAYLVLFRSLLAGDGRRDEARKAIERARSRPLPSFLPTNTLWANPTAAVTRFPILETATGKTVKVATANLMTDLVVKRTIPRPLAYAVEPRAAGEIGSLLVGHGVRGEMLAAPRSVVAEPCTLVRVEEEFDEVHARYGGRQVVRCAEGRKRILPAGSLWVPLEGEGAARAALLLEPTSLYGLYQLPRYRALAGPDGLLPVLRVEP